MIAKITGYKGKIVWDKSKPDGPAQKIFDVQKMKNSLKFECSTPLQKGIKKTIKWFENNYPDGIRL